MSIMELENVVGRLENRVKRLEFAKRRPAAGTSPRSDVEKIQAVVAARFEYTRKGLLMPGREQPRAWARQIAMYLCRELIRPSCIGFRQQATISLNEIGREFGGLDHGTVLFAQRRVLAAMEVSMADHELVENLRAKCVAELKS